MFSLIHMKDGIKCEELNKRKKDTLFCGKYVNYYIMLTNFFSGIWLKNNTQILLSSFCGSGSC